MVLFGQGLPLVPFLDHILRRVWLGWGVPTLVNVHKLTRVVDLRTLGGTWRRRVYTLAGDTMIPVYGKSLQVVARRCTSLQYKYTPQLLTCGAAA